MRDENRRWAHLCRCALWSPIGTTEGDVIDGRFSANLRRFIALEVANQPAFDRVITNDDLKYVIRSRAFILRTLRNPPSGAAAVRDLLWPNNEENDTRFHVSTRDEKRLLGSFLSDLLSLLPTTPAADVFDSRLYRTRPTTYGAVSDPVVWTREVVLFERYTEEIRSNWGDVLAFVDSCEPRQLETALQTCELGVILAVIQRVADVERAIEMVRHAPVPVALVALAMLIPERGAASRPSRSITEAYEAFLSGRSDADARLQHALAARSESQEAEHRLWNDVVAALSSRRDFAAALAVLGNSTDHPIARAGFEQALAPYTDVELCSAIDDVHRLGVRAAGDLMLLRGVAGATGAEQALARIHDIGKALGRTEGCLLLFDPVDAGPSGLDLHLNGLASEFVQDLSAAMRSVRANVDATIQLLRGRYLEVTHDAKNGALAQILALAGGLAWLHQNGSAALKSAAPRLIEGITNLLDSSERFFEWFDSLDVSEHLMPKLFECAVQVGDAGLIGRLRDTLRRAFSFGETMQSWPAWLPQDGDARSELVRALHQDVLHDHGAYFVGTHRFNVNTTPDALRPFLEVDCSDCERLVLERLAGLPNRHSVLRSISVAALENVTADAVKCASTLRSYPLLHESWCHFRNAIVVAAQRLVPEIRATEARTAWARPFEAGILDRTSLLASEVAR